jgi:hypothetical protein
LPLLPFPLKLTTCGLLVALSVNVSVPEKGPAAIGDDDTLIVQLLFAPTLGAQLLDSTKPELVDIPENFTEARPGLVTVTVCGALVVPTL